MTIRRVALIDDGVQRPETTGGYCLRALSRLVEVEHFEPGELDRVPHDGFDLYLNIDDGMRYHLPPDLRPSAWWAIDTHLDFAWSHLKAQGFDAVFAAQRDGVEKLRQAGIRSATWLPLACDPEIHGKHEVAKQYDVAFVGNNFPGARADLLNLIRRKYPSSFIGQCYFAEMARVYSSARIAFNRSIKNDINMRVFESLASGSLLATNDLNDNGQAELFRDGVHLAAYREPEDLLDKLAFYLGRESLRETIAAAGRAEVLEKHTYGHRMQRLLREAEGALARKVVALAGCNGALAADDGMARLFADFPWPDAAPEVPAPQGPLGWLGDGAGRMLAAELKSSTRVVIELGSWLGMSTRFIADQAPGAVVVAVDHWQGSREHQEHPEWREMLTGLYESFLALNWSYRDRIIPLKMSTIEGLEVVAAQGIVPDLIYFDADHGYEALLENLDLAWRLFPGATLVGDDYDQPDVARAVVDFAARHNLDVEVAGESWRAWKLCVRQPGVVRPTGPQSVDSGSASESKGPDPFYFGHVRPEILALVPPTAQSVLDVGCGAGRLGEAIKARQVAEVVGIELNPAAGAAARHRLDQVFVGDVECLELPFPPGRFDAIVCGDVLEHLREPERLLRRAKTWLAPDGSLIASIPNVRHHSVVRSVLEGNWTYESAGLLDRTHLRFFTRREIEKLFFRAGFAIDEMRSIVGPGDHEAADKLNGSVQVGRLAIGGLSEQDAQEFYTYQYLVRARPAAVPGYGTTSIVIVTYNQLEHTRRCLDSISRLTDEPYELIVVDNGSTDGTVEYLRTISGMRLIVNASNRGFPAAANQGMAIATGNQMLLLNNDVVVTTGWLFRLLKALYSDPAIGLVGPCSNFVSGPQQVEASYESLADLDGFAWDWGGAHEGVRTEVNRLVGFCLLIRRAVVETIGYLDEQFGVGCFEDDDYCLRAIQAGYRAVIAGDAFVHHHGGATFVSSGVDFGVILRENGERFRAKWAGNGVGPASSVAATCSSAPGAVRKLPGPFTVEAAPGGGLQMRLQASRPRLSLCMIVRDSARTLPACLESIRPWVDEMVIVDTGSVDETPRIVESFGGRLFHFPWCDDFSAARNESLKHAQGDWLFWMDSDDTIPPDCGRKLRALADREFPPHVLGFVMQVHCPGAAEDGAPDTDVTMVDHVKLFRNRPDMRFDHRIHEQILPAIRAAQGEVAWTDIYVVHSGSDQSAPAQQKKLERDLRILQRELAERPEHPFTLFNLGMTYCHASRYAEAIDHLRRGIARSGAGESHVRKAFALLIYALMRLGRHGEAIEACRQAREHFPRDTELRFREGVLLHECGLLEESRRAYLDVLTTEDERHFSSVDRALTGFKVRQNLAVVANDMGDLDEAERRWFEVVREVPGYRQGWRGLGETLMRGNRIGEVESLAEGLLSDGELRIEGLLLKSRTALGQGRLEDAREALDHALAECPVDAQTLRERCQFLFVHGTIDEAEAALRALIDRFPDDAAAHHNLGTLLMRVQRHDEAVQEFRLSLKNRPNYAATYLNLGHALKSCGRMDEAATAWEEVLRLSPNQPAVREELARLRGEAMLPVG